MSWFNVDKAGLAAILERRGKFFAIAELISNAWDSDTHAVSVSIKPVAGKPFAELCVEDWGEGFADLADAHTLFSSSRRGGDAEKRGRFSLGEKLVLSLCRWARIQTACGTICFKEDGTVSKNNTKSECGTVFSAEIRMTREEYDEVVDTARRLIPPVATKFNGVDLDRPDSLCRFQIKLPTEIADADGQLRRTSRIAMVEVYESIDGTGELLELGIPVVGTDNGYRVNVLQKIPLNMDRDNVTPAFLKAINSAVLNHMHDQLTEEEAAKPWVQEAAGDARATPEAVKTVIVKRFGDHAVVATPNDPAANANAAAAGFTVIPGGSLAGDLWGNVRKHQLLLPSSKVFPTPTPEAVAAARGQKCPLCGK